MSNHTSHITIYTNWFATTWATPISARPASICIPKTTPATTPRRHGGCASRRMGDGV